MNDTAGFTGTVACPYVTVIGSGAVLGFLAVALVCPVAFDAVVVPLDDFLGVEKP
ncbi:MAG TPA: hypothetical protein VF450_10170 [Noviherbaspirillum sp.]